MNSVPVMTAWPRESQFLSDNPYCQDEAWPLIDLDNYGLVGAPSRMVVATIIE